MKSSRVIRLLGVVAAALVGASAVSAQNTTIDFETNAPPLFIQTTPLTDRYSNLGATFSGVLGNGGSILDQSGGFGLNARSGNDFLAFNGALSSLVEQVTFSSAVSSVSIYLGSGDDSTYQLLAFDVNGLPLGASVSVGTKGAYSQLAVSTPGIRSVRFSGTGAYYVADDLSFSTADLTAAAPEPAVWTMMLLGFGVAGFALRRRTVKSRLSYAA